MHHSLSENNSITKEPMDKLDPYKLSWVMAHSSLMRNPCWLLAFSQNLRPRKMNQLKSSERMSRPLHMKMNQLLMSGLKRLSIKLLTLSAVGGSGSNLKMMRMSRPVTYSSD